MGGLAGCADGTSSDRSIDEDEEAGSGSVSLTLDSEATQFFAKLAGTARAGGRAAEEGILQGCIIPAHVLRGNV